MASVTRRRRTGRDGQPKDTERAVLEAVERLLAADESFTELAVGRIADEAGIGRTTFYGAFPDKPTLLMRLADAVTGDLFVRAADWVRDDVGTAEELDDVLAELVGEHRAHAPLLRAVTEVAGYEPAVADFWRARINAFADVLRARIERDLTAGTAAPGLDPAVTASYIAWGTERSIALHVATRPARDDAAFARALAAAVWATTGRPPAGSARSSGP